MPAHVNDKKAPPRMTYVLLHNAIDASAKKHSIDYLTCERIYSATRITLVHALSCRLESKAQLKLIDSKATTENIRLFLEVIDELRGQYARHRYLADDLIAPHLYVFATIVSEQLRVSQKAF